MANRYSTRAVGLSDAKIRGLKPPGSGQIEIPDMVVPGLRLRVGTGGTKTFILRKRVADKYRNITIGRYSERMSLAAARKKARTLLTEFDFKADPAASIPKPRRRIDNDYTLSHIYPDYLSAKSHLRRAHEIDRVFRRHILPEFGDRAADSITRGEITRFIDKIAVRTPVMARNVLSCFSSFYGWALPRLDRLPGNPCRDAGRPPAPKPRERVLSENEVGALWHVLDAQGYPFGPAIKLLLLTGQRRAEVFEAGRDEFDFAARLWTIPSERAKNNKTHLVPLGPTTLKIVRMLITSALKEANIGKEDRDSDKLLPARGNLDAGPSGFSKAMTRIRSSLEERVGQPVPHWTLHDLRRTAATGLQRLGIRLEVTEAVLNHVSGSRSGIVGVYQRHNYFNEKRQALRAWEQEVKRLAKRHRRKPKRPAGLGENSAQAHSQIATAKISTSA